MDNNSAVIRRLLENDIVGAYYYQKGVIAHFIKSDTQIAEAKKLLLDGERYKSILQPAAKEQTTHEKHH